MRNKGGTNKTRVAVLTADGAFEQSVRVAFGSEQIDLRLVNGTLAANEHSFDVDSNVIVLDFDVSQGQEMVGLQRVMARVNDWPPVVVIAPSFDKDVARQLLQMRVADFSSSTARFQTGAMISA